MRLVGAVVKEINYFFGVAWYKTICVVCPYPKLQFTVIDSLKIMDLKNTAV